MKFSYQWISELVGGLNVQPQELQRLITMKTAECEGIEPFGAHFAEIAIARVLEAEPIAGGKNKLVTLQAGREQPISVVCGAPNVAVGSLVAWVPPGTSLGEKHIGTAIFDGIVSEGMLASAGELGISRDHSGLLVVEEGTPGEKLDGVSPDWVIEIDNKSLTHRPDLWGHLGMAREVSAILGLTLSDPVKLSILPQGSSALKVQIEDFSLCPRYSALVVENIEGATSPLWLQARLQAIGLNPISGIVDVTNFVLAELPQPMHAFDADKLVGDTIFVRNAREGERLEALNGETYELEPDDLVIADAAGPIALAGVIGGAASAISNTTRRIIFESANFQASSVRLTSARHKLRTDASMRFEKSLDPENTVRGLARALELTRVISPETRCLGGVVDVQTQRASLPRVDLPVSFVSRKLGVAITAAEIERILTALGFGTTASEDGFLVSVPTWRATKDISHKDDLVEEIGRMIGYDQIPPKAPLVAAVVPPANAFRAYVRGIRLELAAQGFTEAYNYSFLSEAELARFGFRPGDALKVVNPLASDLTHLRPSLLPRLFKNIADNVRHYREFRLFEIGNEIHLGPGSELPDEIPHAAAVSYSAVGSEIEFFELKRVLESVLPGAKLHGASARAYEHPARAAEVEWHGQVVGRLFELHPSVLETEGIEGRAVLFDIDLRETERLAGQVSFRYRVLRKYPTSGLDLSVVTETRTPVATIKDALVAASGADLASIDFVRQYDGPPLRSGQKSVTYHLEIGAPDHTITAEEITRVRNRILDQLRDLGFDFRI
ncbi:MAG: phenylalanine--tRNA ligase subunit beta [Bryobacteraceae bacterium]